MEWRSRNVIYYLAVAPEFFPTIAANLAKNKLASDTDRTRIVIEKPFGHDLESARDAEQAAVRYFRRAPDLPHRPLPGQGNRAEHHGLPLCQCAV